MTRSANWSPYVGSSSIILAVALLVVTGLLLYLAVRLSHPVGVKRPGMLVGALIVVIWMLSAVMFLVAITVYVDTLFQQVGRFTGPTDPITSVTMTAGLLSFVAISFLTRRSGFWVALGSAIVGAIAAPMIFELPFDLIVMEHTYPPTPAALFTLLYFLPLILVEVSSFAMLMLSSAMKLSRFTLLLLAGMFFTFAVWALFGFAYPSTPLPIALNVIAKILAFAAAVSLFLPEGNFASVINPIRIGAETSALAANSRGLT